MKHLRTKIAKYTLYIKEHPFLSLGWLIFCLWFLWTIWETYEADNLGFSKKTLWDWMGLLIVPATLGIGAFLLGKWQTDNERKITRDNQRQAMLETYFDKMADLLLDDNLRTSESGDVHSIARTRTLILFRQLDGIRKGDALQFLYEAGLISGSEPVVQIIGLNLDGADLSGASIIGINLVGTTCTNTNFKDANLSEAILTGCLFNDSEMQAVNFSGALLDQAIFLGCNLVGAQFSEASLNMASFKNSSVTLDQLTEAKSKEDLVMPNGYIYSDEAN